MDTGPSQVRYCTIHGLLGSPCTLRSVAVTEKAVFDLLVRSHGLSPDHDRRRKVRLCPDHFLPSADDIDRIRNPLDHLKVEDCGPALTGGHCAGKRRRSSLTSSCRTRRAEGARRATHSPKRSRARGRSGCPGTEGQEAASAATSCSS